MQDSKANPAGFDGMAQQQSALRQRLRRLPMQRMSAPRSHPPVTREERLTRALEQAQMSGLGAKPAYPWLFRQLRMAGLGPRPLHYMALPVLMLWVFVCSGICVAGLFFFSEILAVFFRIGNDLGLMPVRLFLVMNTVLSAVIVGAIRLQARAHGLSRWRDL